MPLAQQILAWRKFRGLSATSIAEKLGVTLVEFEAIEAGDLDPPVSLIECLAFELGIPSSWVHCDPLSIQLLTKDLDDENGADLPDPTSPDPVTDRILQGTQQDRELYVLLTALLQSGEPRLLRAAEVNLRSLLKQVRRTTLPWQSRTPGHFEPPSD
jgi:transcriptional regulator with XRE-family HTH domain